MDWNDLRLFLAVARHGSIRAAAMDLNINQSTVNRRMDVLEHDLRLVLFDRTTRGLSLTEHGRAIAAAALPMQERAECIMAESERLGRNLSGALKITAPQTVGVVFVVPIIALFRARYPDVVIDYDLSEKRFDLQSGEADIAFRAAYDAPEDTLAHDLVHEHEWAVYCSRTFADRHGMPCSVADLPRFPAVTLGGAVGGGAGIRWFNTMIDPARISGVARSVPNMAQILQAGLGVGILPVITARQEAGLVRCFGPLPELRTRMWIVTTYEQRRVPRVAAFVQTALAWFREGNGHALERAD